LRNHPYLDRESFQRLLASAFAVQESGMKPQSLAVILELQRSIRTGHLDVDGAAHLIAEWARSVTNASGVAIGRLKGDQLVYTAGSGSAASYIGRRVMATFSTVAHNEIPTEILRVEDTTADDRIEAAVCRQFGVKSLLILPIYCGRFVAGVLQVLFKEAHSFQEQEVRAYWIFGELIGEAMLKVPGVQKRNATVRPAMTEEGIEHFPAPQRETVNNIKPVEVAHGRRQIDEGAPPEDVRSFPFARSPFRSSFAMLRMNHLLAYRLRPYTLYPYNLPAYMRDRISGLVVASIILISTWILCTAGPATMSSVAVAPLKSPNVDAQQIPPWDASQRRLTTTAAAFPAKPNYPTVHYVASAGQKRSSGLGSRVKHFGNDVTVRYFTPREGMTKMAADSEVHQVSDDVTVRYFKPRNVGPSAEPAVAGSSQSVSR